ncbi:SOS response-associated peptidase family protein [Phenylobacterium sp.]|uniref:SOS response-associated peptidase family protein n=1 Tax=Phenylobacterium sp. TaxID=1871053 RepID=UPI00286B96C4|nr:SOS response-associated peptidase family protein [Phenylobacterium sp.]
MCNLYELDVDLLGWAKAHEDFLGRRLPLPAGAAEGQANLDMTWKTQLYPDYRAPILRHDGLGGQTVAFARWGLPSSRKALMDAAGKRADKLRAKGKAVSDADFAELLRLEPDKGTTNVRNTASRHWKPYLEPANRCLVPLTAFCEPDQVGGSRQNVWFAPADGRPLAYFAGVHTLDHGCVRKIRTGWETCDLFGFLTTNANAEVAQVHDKAMPVILTTPQDCETWMTAPWSEAAALQRPLPDGFLSVVARSRSEAAPRPDENSP